MWISFYPVKCDIVTCPAPIAFSDIKTYYNVILKLGVFLMLLRLILKLMH